MKLYKANIIFTRDKDRFEAVENGYVGVENGRVVDVASSPDAFGQQVEEVIDYGDCLLIPAMNDMHVHAGQYRNQGISMDLALLEWLNNYTFPEEAKYSDTRYARRMYSRFVHDLWRYGTMRTATFATTHLESTRLLMELFREAGMGALVGKVNMDRNSIDALLETVDESVAANETLIAEWNDPDSLVRPILTPRFIPSCTNRHKSTRCPCSLTCLRTWVKSPWCVSWSPRAASMVMPMTDMVCSGRHQPSWHTASSVKAKNWN